MLLADGQVWTPKPRYPWLEKGQGVAFDIEKLGLHSLTMSRVSKVAVPLMELDRVHELFSRRAQIIQSALNGGPLPDRWTDDPRTSTFCTEWCANYESCLQS